MPYMQVPSGKWLEVPEGIPYETAMATARAQLPIEFGIKPQEGLWADIKRGGGEAATAGLTAFKGWTGSPVEAARQGIAQQELHAKQFAQPTQWEDVTKAYNAPEGGILSAAGTMGKMAKEQIAGMAPTMATSMAMGRTGAMVGAALPIPFAAPVLGGLGALAPWVMQMAGENAMQQERAHPGQVDMATATAAAVPQAAVGMAAHFLPLGRSIVGSMFGGEVKAAMAKMGQAGVEAAAQRTVGQAVARGVGLNALVQAPAMVTQEMLGRWQAGQPLTDNDALTSYGKAAMTGTLLSPLGAIGGISDRSAAQAKVKMQDGIKAQDEAKVAAAAKQQADVEKAAADQQAKEQGLLALDQQHQDARATALQAHADYLAKNEASEVLKQSNDTTPLQQAQAIQDAREAKAAHKAAQDAADKLGKKRQAAAPAIDAIKAKQIAAEQQAAAQPPAEPPPPPAGVAPTAPPEAPVAPAAPQAAAPVPEAPVAPPTPPVAPPPPPSQSAAPLIGRAAPEKVLEQAPPVAPPVAPEVAPPEQALARPAEQGEVVAPPVAPEAPVAPPPAPVDPLTQHLSQFVPPGTEDPLRALLGPNNDPRALVQAIAQSPEISSAIIKSRKAIAFPGAPDAETSRLWKTALIKQRFADTEAAKAESKNPVIAQTAAMLRKKTPKVELPENMMRPIDQATNAYGDAFDTMMDHVDLLARGEYRPDSAVMPPGAEAQLTETQALDQAHAAKPELISTAVHRAVAAREARGEPAYTKQQLAKLYRDIGSMTDALIARARRADVSPEMLTAQMRSGKPTGRVFRTTEERERYKNDKQFATIYGEPWVKREWMKDQKDKLTDVIERYKSEIEKRVGAMPAPEKLGPLSQKMVGTPWFTGVEEARTPTSAAQHIERTAATIETALANRHLDPDTRATLAKAQLFLQENGVRAESRVMRDANGEIVNRDVSALSPEDRLPANKLLPARIPEVLLKDIDAMAERARRGMPEAPELGRQVLDHIKALEQARDQTGERFGEQGTLFGEAPMTPRNEWEKRRIAAAQQKAAKSKVAFTGSQVEMLENQIKVLDTQFEKAKKKHPAAAESAAKISAQLEDLKRSPSMLGGAMQDTLGKVESVFKAASDHQEKLAAARSDAEAARARMVNEFYGAIGESEAAKSMQSIPEAIRRYRMLMNATPAIERMRARQFEPILDKLRVLGAEKEELTKAAERRDQLQRGEYADPADRAKIERRRALDEVAALKDVDHRIDTTRKQLGTLVDKAKRDMEPSLKATPEAPVAYEVKQPHEATPLQVVTRVAKKALPEREDAAQTRAEKALKKAPWKKQPDLTPEELAAKEKAAVDLYRNRHEVETGTEAAKREGDAERWKAEAADRTDTLRSQNLIDKYTDFRRKIGAFEAAKERWNEYIGKAVPEDPKEAAALAKERTKVTPEMLKEVLKASAEARFAESAYQKARGQVNDLRKSLWDKGPGREAVSLREEPNAETLRQVMREGHVIADSKYSTKISRGEPTIALGRGQRPEPSRNRTASGPLETDAARVPDVVPQKGAETLGERGGSPQNIQPWKTAEKIFNEQKALLEDVQARLATYAEAKTEPRTVDLLDDERLSKKVNAARRKLLASAGFASKHGDAEATAILDRLNREQRGDMYRVASAPATEAKPAKAPAAAKPATAPPASAALTPAQETRRAFMQEQANKLRAAGNEEAALKQEEQIAKIGKKKSVGKLSQGEVAVPGEGSVSPVVHGEAATLFDPAETARGVTVTESAAALPAEIRDTLPANAKAVTHQGHVYLIADRIKPGQTRGVLLHELGVHVGMDDATVAKLHDSLVRMSEGDGEHAQWAKDALQSMAESASASTRDEAVAHFVERAVREGIDPANPPTGLAKFFKPLVDAVKSMLVKMGARRYDLMPQDFVDYAYGAARQALKEPPPIKEGQLSYSQRPKYGAGFDPELVATARELFKPKDSFMAKLDSFMKGIRYATVDSKDSLDKLAKTFGDQKAAEQMMFLVRQYEKVAVYARNTLTNGPMTLRRTKSAYGGADDFVFGHTGGPSGIDIARKLGETKEPGLDNFAAIGELFKLYITAKRAEAMPEGYEKLYGKNVAPEQIARLKSAGTKGDLIPQFREARDMYEKYNHGLIDMAVEAGGMSKEKGDLLKNAKDYVSWYRVDGDKVNLIVNGERIGSIGNLKTQPYLKELVGGDAKLTGFFDGLIRNTNMLTDIALRNLTTRNVANTLQQMGLATIRKKPPMNHLQRNVLEFKEGGEKKYALLDTDAMNMRGVDAERVIMGLDGVTTQLPAIIKVLGAPAQVFRHFILRTPAYAFRQVVRDSTFNGLIAGVDGVPIFNSLKNMARLSANGGALNREMEIRGLSGGQTITGTHADQQVILHELGSGKMGYHLAMAKLDHMAMLADTASRLSAYETAIARGASELQAITYAQEVMNFSRRGASPSMRMMNAVVPFFNAQIQGLDVLYRGLRGQLPLTEKLDLRNKLAVRGTMAVAASLMYASAMKDDPEYKKATVSDRLNNIFFKLPFTDQTLKLPIPFEAGYIFKSLPELLVNAANDQVDGREAMDALYSMTMNAIPGAVPIGVKPVLETLANYDFYSGRAIETPQMEGMRMSERFTPGTKELSKHLAGSVDINGREVGISPVMLEHLVRGYTSGLGMAALGMADGLFSSAAPRPESQPWNNPIYGQLLVNKDLSNAQIRARDYIETMTQAQKTYQNMVKQGRVEDATAFASKYSDQMAQAGYASGVRKQLGSIAQMKKQIAYMRDLQPEQKRKMIEDVNNMAELAAQQANTVFRQMAAAH